MRRAVLGTPAQASRVFGVPLGLLRRWLPPLLAAALCGFALGRVLGALAILALVGVLTAAAWLLGLHPIAAGLVRLRRLRERQRAEGLAVEAGVARSGGRSASWVVVLGAQHAVLGREDDELDAAWGELVRQLASALRGGERFVLRATVVPASERERDLDADDGWLAARSWVLETHLGVVSAPYARRARRHALSRCLEAVEADLSSWLQFEQVDPRQLAGALLPPSLGLGPGSAEEVDCLELDCGVLRALRVRRLPGEPLEVDQLAALVAPSPPRRVVSLIAEPLDPHVAARTLGRQRVEVVADQRMRSDHGYRLSVGELDAADRLDLVERELAAGHRLCRWELVVVVAAPSRRELVTATADVLERAAACRLELAPLLGHQRSACEMALLGVVGWS